VTDLLDDCCLELNQSKLNLLQLVTAAKLDFIQLKVTATKLDLSVCNLTGPCATGYSNKTGPLCKWLQQPKLDLFATVYSKQNWTFLQLVTATKLFWTFVQATKGTVTGKPFPNLTSATALKPI
jgi:hypothetical protein